MTATLSEFKDKFTNFNTVVLGTTNVADTLTVASTEVSSWNVTSTDSKDVVKLTGDNTASVDLSGKSGFSGGYDLSAYSGSVTMTADQFNAATFGDGTTVTLSGSGAVNASKYVALIGDSGVRLSLADGGKSLSINADTNDDASSDGWSITALPSGVTTLSISGTESVDLSGVATFNLTKIDTTNDEDVSGDQTVILSKTQFAKVGADGDGLAISGDASDVLCVDEQLVGDTYGSVTGSGNGVFITVDGANTTMYTLPTLTTSLELSSSDDVVKFTGSSYSDNTGDGIVLDAGDGNDYVKHNIESGIEALVGGNGADFLQGGSLMFAGIKTEATNGVYAEGTDTVSETGIAKETQWVFLGADDWWAAHTLQTKIVTGHNVLNPVNGWGGKTEDSATYSPDVVLSDEADTVMIQGGNSATDAADCAMNVKIHQFEVGEDAIVYLNQSTKVGENDSDNRTWTAWTAELKTVNAGAFTIDKSAHTVTVDWLKLQNGTTATSVDGTNRMDYGSELWQTGAGDNTTVPTTLTFLDDGKSGYATAAIAALTTDTAGDFISTLLTGDTTDEIDVIGSFTLTDGKLMGSDPVADDQGA